MNYQKTASILALAFWLATNRKSSAAKRLRINCTIAPSDWQVVHNPITTQSTTFHDMHGKLLPLLIY